MVASGKCNGKFLYGNVNVQGIAGSGGGGSVTVMPVTRSRWRTGHPFSNSDTVTFSGGTSVGGASLNGSFTVANATANSYTVTSTSQGIAGSGGGGLLL